MTEGPVKYNCVKVLDSVYSSRPDLQGQLWIVVDWELYVDGGSFINPQGERCAGYAVATLDTNRSQVTASKHLGSEGLDCHAHQTKQQTSICGELGPEDSNGFGVLLWKPHTAYCPQSSGKANRMNRTIKNSLGKVYQETGSKWVQALPLVLSKIRCTPFKKKQDIPL
ncbi:Gag-Pol polyprotein [Plecturocebus cupreus]